MKRIRAVSVLTVAMLFMLCACGKTEMEQNTGSQTGSTSEGAENWRSEDETQHTVEDKRDDRIGRI